MDVRNEPQDFLSVENQQGKEHSQTVKDVIKTTELQDRLMLLTLNSTQEDHTHSLGSCFGFYGVADRPRPFSYCLGATLHLFFSLLFSVCYLDRVVLKNSIIPLLTVTV